MQVVVGEAAADQRGHGDLLQVRRQGAPPVVAQRVPALLPDQLVALPDPPQAEAPQPDEAVLTDAARAHQVPVGVGESFPGADRLQAGRLQCRRLPLRDGQVGHAEHADGAGAPRLRRGPLDQVVDILAFLIRQQAGRALRGAGAAQITVDHRVALGRPPGRVGCLPPGQGRKPHRGRLPQNPVLKRHPPAAAAPPRQVVLAVRVRRHQHREPPATRRQHDVHPQGRAVAHGHWKIPQHRQRTCRGLVHTHRWAQQPGQAAQRIPHRPRPVPRPVQPSHSRLRAHSVPFPSSASSCSCIFTG